MGLQRDKTYRYFSVEISLQMQYMQKRIIKDQIKNTPTCAMGYIHTATDTRISENYLKKGLMNLSKNIICLQERIKIYIWAT